MNYFLSRNRRGLSLLEVILAIAILGGSMAVIFELVRIGVISAIETRVRSEANILCDAKMAEVSAGVIELKPIAATIIGARTAMSGSMPNFWSVPIERAAPKAAVARIEPQ